MWQKIIEGEINLRSNIEKRNVFYIKKEIIMKIPNKNKTHKPHKKKVFFYQ
jgi:hypothetical protein